MLPEETMEKILALMGKGYTYQEAVKEIQSHVNVIYDAFNSDFENTWDWDEWN